MLFHTVIFWLKKSLTSEEKDFFFTEVKKLGEIPSVENFLIGTPANTTKRPVIDDSYDCYLTVVLKDLLHMINIKRTQFTWTLLISVKIYGKKLLSTMLIDLNFFFRLRS